MIHIATVHWQDESWIDVQLQFLCRNVREPYRVYAWLNEVPEDHKGKFYYVNTEAIESHAIKLNLLADMISFNADQDSDLLLFLDGDAFPIGDVISFARDRLTHYPLVAVQRRENNGDIQPHPCFCVTTVGFWKQIGGDWKSGPAWLDAQGKPTTDVGGHLLSQLEKHGAKWYPMLRSNRVNIHPLWFGVYEDVVYHHGGGFRAAISRYDCNVINQIVQGTWRRSIVWAFDSLPPFFRGSWKLRRFDPREKLKERKIRHNIKMIQDMYVDIVNNPTFYTQLI